MSKRRVLRRKTVKPIPTFKSEGEEHEFWATRDTVDYVDWSRARWVAFPNLKPSTEAISLRLPASLLADLKILANKRDVPYQSLLKMFLADRVAREWARETAAMPNERLQPSRARPGSRSKRVSKTRPRS